MADCIQHVSVLDRVAHGVVRAAIKQHVVTAACQTVDVFFSQASSRALLRCEHVVNLTNTGGEVRIARERGATDQTLHGRGNPVVGDTACAAFHDVILTGVRLCRTRAEQAVRWVIYRGQWMPGHRHILAAHNDACGFTHALSHRACLACVLQLLQALLLSGRDVQELGDRIDLGLALLDVQRQTKRVHIVDRIGYRAELGDVEPGFQRLHCGCSLGVVHTAGYTHGVRRTALRPCVQVRGRHSLDLIRVRLQGLSFLELEAEIVRLCRRCLHRIAVRLGATRHQHSVLLGYVVGCDPLTYPLGNSLMRQAFCSFFDSC